MQTRTARPLRCMTHQGDHTMTTATPDLDHPSRRDLFLSYRRLDAERVAPLVDALNARGITVWQDASEIDTLTSIQHAINDGLANARALLVWYSKDYNASRACQWELTTAYSAAQAAGDDPRRRVLVVNAEVGTQAHIVLPELFDQLHLNAAALSVDEMAERIQARLDDAAGGVPATTLGSVRALGRPAWYGSAGLGSTRFVGRLREMWALHAVLQAEQAAMLTGVGGAGRPGVLQVRGSGGMGKSLLAEEYALRFGAAYPGGVFWLRAFGYSDSDREMDPAVREAQRDSQVIGIATHLGVETHGLSRAQIGAGLHRHFAQKGQPFLWIVDDLPPVAGDPETELTPWLAPHPLGRTLITTRARLVNHVAAVELPQLEVDEALRLLARGKALSAADEAAARAICAELGYHALAVDVAAALVARRGYAKVLENLRQPDRDALEFAATQFREALPNGHERSIAATLLASLRELDEPARDLLRLAAVLAAVAIPRELQWRAIMAADALDEDDAQDVTDPAAAQLIDTSLADDAGDGAITVHTLVVRTVRFHDGKPERVEALRGAAVGVLLTKMPPVVDIRTHKALKDWVAHARQVSAEAEDVPTAYLLGWVGRHDKEQGAYESARQSTRRQLDTIWRILGQDHPDTLSALNNLATILLDQGDLVGARHCAEQVLDTRQGVLGQDHPDTLSALNNLATILLDQGDLVGARRYAEQVLDTQRCVLSQDHPDTLKSMGNLATISYAQGDLVGARRYAEQVLDTMRRVLGQEHPHTLSALNNLATILKAQGDLVGARRYAEHVLDTQRRALGQDHPLTLTSLNNLGQILQAQGDLVGARRYAEQVLDTRLRLLGEDHPHTLSALNNLATVLQDQGDLVGARRYAEQALDTQQRVLGQDHPLTLTVLNNLGQILQDQGDLVGARRYAEQVLDTMRGILGERHTDTSVAAWNLFTLLATIGEREPAVQMLHSNLLWLLAEDPEQLGAAQRQIAGMVGRAIGRT
ncbi:toll/interleukin-1 receptor domain-containing protein [Sphaerotilus sp.]|uniref:tetratricopeptide repeat protein n=1 Tax=Sphaerotilus sp. TaxID=2093942 RepID=UPI002ACE8193|nr:toll/interleukin-1 receptor domain-containing protein [Sphaerotilus sp.]MDZ7856440.1 toll/interleukin-1 receptor domain-containing protein [Sphaerotilus sp.]